VAVDAQSLIWLNKAALAYTRKDVDGPGIYYNKTERWVSRSGAGTIVVAEHANVLLTIRTGLYQLPTSCGWGIGASKHRNAAPG
jgi:hypothetical protein